MTVTDIDYRRTRTRSRRQSDDVSPADPRIAELQAALRNERYRPFWPDLHAELVELTATGILAA